MKNLTRKGLIALALSVSLMGYASDLSTPGKEKEPNVTSLSFAKVRQGSVLYIKDGNGLVIYRESIVTTGAYSKGFDLTSLPNGGYFFELDSEIEVVVIPFDVLGSEVSFKKEEKTTIFKPVIRVKDDIVFVSRISFEAAPLEYKVYFAENSDVILSEKFEEDSLVERIYDFSQARKGEYLFVFRSNGRKFLKSIKI